MRQRSQNRRDRSRQRAARLYALLLRLYPHAYQRLFAEQMLETFWDHYRDAVEQGGEPAARFWLGVLADEGRSLVHEYRAAFVERARSMRSSISAKKLLFSALAPVVVIAGVSLIVTVIGLFHTGAFNNNGSGFLLEMLLAYLALLFLIARFLHNFPLVRGNGSWWRRGLAFGGVFSLYMVALNLLYALAPIHQLAFQYGGNVLPVWMLSLPLLAGVVGVLAGFGSGDFGRGLAASVLACIIALLANIVSMDVLVVILWNQLQHNLLPSQLQVDAWAWIQQQWSAQHPGLSPSLQAYLTTARDDDSMAFGLIVETITAVFTSIVPIAIGVALGVVATKRASYAQPAAAAPGAQSRRIALFALLLLVLGVLMWSSYTLLQGTLTGSGPVFLLKYLGVSYFTPAFFAWLAGFLFILASLSLSVQSAARMEGD